MNLRLCCPKCDHYIKSKLIKDNVFSCFHCQADLAIVYEYIDRSQATIRICTIEKLDDEQSDQLGVRQSSGIYLVKGTNDYYEARMIICIFGSMNDPNNDHPNGFNPFSEHCHENIVIGKGKSQEEVINNMKEDHKKMSDSMWA